MFLKLVEGTTNRKTTVEHTAKYENGGKTLAQQGLERKQDYLKFETTTPPTTASGVGGAAGAGGVVDGTTARAVKASGLRSTGTAGAAMRASATNGE